MTADCKDLSIEDLLRDGMTQAVMRADRVDPTQFAAMLRNVAVVLKSARRPPVKTVGSDRPVAERGLIDRSPASIGRVEDHLGCFARPDGRSQCCGAP